MNEEKKLPKILDCPNCGIEIELDESERKGKKFICPECNSSINMAEYEEKTKGTVIDQLSNPKGTTKTKVMTTFILLQMYHLLE